MHRGFTNNLLNVRSSDPVYMMYSRFVVEELSRRRPELAGLVAAEPRLLYVIGDSFFLHYSFKPLLRDSPNPDPLLEVFREGMIQYSLSHEYEGARRACMLDEELSLIHAYNLVARFLEKLLDRVREEAGKECCRVVKELEGMGRRAPKSLFGGEARRGREEDLRRMVERVFGGGRSRHASPALSRILGKVLRREAVAILADSAREAAEDLRDVGRVRRLFGGRLAGDLPGSLSLGAEIRDLMRVEGVRKIVSAAEKLVSSVPRFARILKRRGWRGEEVFGYAFTSNPLKAIPRELALPDELFLARMSTSSFLSREYATVWEGAYYVLLDKSGSMGGVKEVWSRSVALAINFLARVKRRRFYLRFFDYRPYELIDDAAKAFKYIVSVLCDGGTSIDSALEAAVKDLRLRRVEGVSTIILITDGEDDVGFPVSRLRSVNASLVSVMVGGDNHSLKELSLKSGGKYLSVAPIERDALKIIDEVT